MRMIIEQGKVKREIEGPFSICASLEDLENMIACIHDRIGRSNDETRPYFSNGWIDIIERPPPRGHSSTPLRWHEAASKE